MQKLVKIMSVPDVAVDEYDLRMNFMILAENKCRTYKNDNLEWIPTVKMWLKRRWILGRLQRFKARKKIRSLNCYKNLKRSCASMESKRPISSHLMSPTWRLRSANKK